MVLPDRERSVTISSAVSIQYTNMMDRHRATTKTALTHRWDHVVGTYYYFLTKVFSVLTLSNLTLCSFTNLLSINIVCICDVKHNKLLRVTEKKSQMSS